MANGLTFPHQNYFWNNASREVIAQLLIIVWIFRKSVKFLVHQISASKFTLANYGLPTTGESIPYKLLNRYLRD